MAWDDQDEILVGQIAKRQAITNPEHTVFSIKRFMGRKYSEVREEINMVPYKVTETRNGDAAVEIKGNNLAPPEIFEDPEALERWAGGSVQAGRRAQAKKKPRKKRKPRR